VITIKDHRAQSIAHWGRAGTRSGVRLYGADLLLCIKLISLITPRTSHTRVMTTNPVKTEASTQLIPFMTLSFQQ
jgi:hypothetical protein